MAVTLVGAAWALTCLVMGAYLLAAHLLTLPTPSSNDAPLRRAIADQRGHWLALHVLYEGYKCSRQIAEHLVASRRPDGVVERVVLVTEPGHDDTQRVRDLQAHGFDAETVSREELVARYHVESAPLLVVADPAGIIRYVGGYTLRKQSPDVQDVAVIEALRRGEHVKPLPAFGCAVGRRLAQQVDPLGIR